MAHSSAFAHCAPEKREGRESASRLDREGVTCGTKGTEERERAGRAIGEEKRVKGWRRASERRREKARRKGGGVSSFLVFLGLIL
eukprot:scaffold269134_cov31-Tisochrysis_lutea.AAC.2